MDFSSPLPASPFLSAARWAGSSMGERRVMKNFMGIGLVVLGLLAGCTTTEEANQAIQGRWIGQPSDAFFSQYGPPSSAFPLNSGGTVYTWRGGETSRTVSAQ